MHVQRVLAALLLAALLFAGGCRAMPEPARVPTVPMVDLPRFMGDWYVIANIPTFLETQSYAATESYRQQADGSIATTFSQRKGSFAAPLKRYNQRAFVREDTGNAAWGMQFIWPFKAEYLITHVNGDYSQAIIARTRRDYVWILARTPELPETEFAALSERVRQLGYDMSKLRRVPQTAPSPAN